ncbi:hypothetical protein [uncultured Vibrio sp.]|uniref:hypothetical protein n=1 Tax=uncultured Vibrio sp. TaxID=114054 RepID=UPI0026030ED7|nr:hypothetical protein [uncultured Vibrio sp.]
MNSLDGVKLTDFQLRIFILSWVFNHAEQAQRCKIAHFGHEMAKEEHHKSKRVIHLQKLGHRLPDILLILRQNVSVERIDH